MGQHWSSVASGHVDTVNWPRAAALSNVTALLYYYTGILTIHELSSHPWANTRSLPNKLCRPSVPGVVGTTYSACKLLLWQCPHRVIGVVRRPVLCWAALVSALFVQPSSVDRRPCGVCVCVVWTLCCDVGRHSHRPDLNHTTARLSPTQPVWNRRPRREARICPALLSYLAVNLGICRQLWSSTSKTPQI